MKAESKLHDLLGKILKGGIPDHSLTGWAKILDVSSPAITQWMNGDTTPSPENLYHILQILESYNGYMGPKHNKALEDCISQFYLMADSPMNELVLHPKKKWKGVTLSDYLIAPQLEELKAKCAKLPFELSKEITAVYNQLFAIMAEKVAKDPKSAPQYAGGLRGMKWEKEVNKSIATFKKIKDLKAKAPAPAMDEPKPPADKAAAPPRKRVTEYA